MASAEISVDIADATRILVDHFKRVHGINVMRINLTSYETARIIIECCKGGRFEASEFTHRMHNYKE